MMLAVLHRAVLPLMLALGAVAALVYGVRHHTVTIGRWDEVEAVIRIPVGPMGFGSEDMAEEDMEPSGEPESPEDAEPPGEPALEGEAPPGGMPPFGPGFGPPAFITQKVKRDVWTTAERSEPALIREVSVGGVALLPTGELVWTYRGEGPSLCPS